MKRIASISQLTDTGLEKEQLVYVEATDSIYVRKPPGEQAVDGSSVVSGPAGVIWSKKAGGGLITPTMSPAAGSFTGTQEVTLTAPVGYTIRYTTNGSTPSQTSGTIYSVPFTVNATTTVKAVAYKSGPVNSGTYTASGISQDLMPVWEDLTPTNPLLTPDDFLHTGSVEAQLAGLRVVDVSAVPGFTHRYLIVWSSDHENVSGVAGIWMAGTDDFQTIVPLNGGNRVIAALEYPDPVVVGNELYILGHKFNSAGNPDQATFWTKSSSGLSFGAQTELITPPVVDGHTGYTETWLESGQWHCKSLYCGGNYSVQARWVASSIEGPWTEVAERIYSWHWEIDAAGAKQSSGGGQGWNRGGVRFQFSSSSTWAGSSGTGGAIRRHSQILVAADGRSVVFPPRETIEPSDRSGHWNSGSFGAARPIRHTDGRLYSVYVADDGNSLNRGIGLMRADETQEAPAIADFPGTPVSVYDATGVVQVGSEYAVLNATDGLDEYSTTAANGTFTYNAGTGLYTMTGTVVGSTYAIGWESANAPDFDNDLEVTLEILGLLHPYLIADIFWSMSLYATGNGARLGWFAGADENWTLRTYGSSPATTDVPTTHDRSGDGMSLIRANVRQNWLLGIRPASGHVWVTLDKYSCIYAAAASASVMGRTGLASKAVFSFIPRVASRTLTATGFRMIRRR